MAQIARNQPCPCGSGKKYKKCCLGKGAPPHPAFGDAQPVGRSDPVLERWIQQGYEAMMAGQSIQACDRWMEIWKTIHPRLRPEMRTCDSTTVVFPATQPLHDWLQDFALELANAAIDEPRYAQTGIELCERVLAQFPDERELFRLNFRADLGQFYFMARRNEQGDRVLQDLIRDHPDRALGYVRLASILTWGACKDDDPIDLPRAKALLEQALARPVTDAADYDLKARLDEISDAPERPTPNNPSAIP
jgi:hypothetical protein